MGKYRISVFKTLLSSDGHPFKCLQFMIDIGRARTARPRDITVKAVLAPFERGGDGRQRNA